MERSIKITAGSVELYGVLHASVTADAIWNALPLSSTAQTWGDEIYFDRSPATLPNTLTALAGRISAPVLMGVGPKNIQKAGPLGQ